VPARIKLKSRRRKYGNQPVWLEGVRFDSKKEAARWWVLQQIEKSGGISGLKRQTSYPLVVNGIKIAAYKADAVYHENGRLVVEDTKSPSSRKIAVYRLKRKLMFALYGIRIRET
jgi:hypothetical protein